MGIKTDEQAWTRRAAGSLRWFRFSASKASGAGELTDAVLSDVRALRGRVREAEGGGGMCHVVADELWKARGWSALSVGYLSTDGEVICAGHYVNILGDGTVVDATADQFGEGHDIRIVRPGDAEYGRYRPEFHEDYNPEIEPNELSAWIPDWTGVNDYDAQDAVAAERGAAWWLDDPSPLLEYLRSQVAIGASKGDGHPSYGMLEGRIEDIEARLAGSAPSA